MKPQVKIRDVIVGRYRTHCSTGKIIGEKKNADGTVDVSFEGNLIVRMTQAELDYVQKPKDGKNVRSKRPKA